MRGFPEVWQVVGKAGRAETPTDPSPLDMVETIINLRDRESGPSGSSGSRTPLAQTRAVLDGLEAKGVLQPGRRPSDREGLVERGGDDGRRRGSTRRSATWPCSGSTEFRPELGRGLVGEAVDALLGRVDPSAVVRTPTPAERATLVDDLADDLRRPARRRAAARRRRRDWSATPSQRLVALGVLRDRPDLLTPAAGPLGAGRARPSARSSGSSRPTLFTRIADQLVAAPRAPAQGADQVAQLGAVRPGRRRRQLGGPRGARRSSAASAKLARAGRDRRGARRRSAAALEKPFADRLLLWKKTKTRPGRGDEHGAPDARLGQHLHPADHQPDRDALDRRPARRSASRSSATTSTRSSASSQEIADGRSAASAGAADVFPDQVIGKGYVEIKIDRKKAARYGVKVGDIQDVVEVAMGGRPLTMTVEGRERYPVRVRYARDFRDDVEALKRHPRRGARHGRRRRQAAGGMGMGGGAATPPRPRRRSRVQVPLAAVADVRVVEGPSMIKSENGLLRAYVQLNVRDRDEVGFVEEARRVVAEKVEAARRACTSNGRAQFEHQVRAQQDAAARLPGRHRADRPDPLPDLQELDDALLMMTSVLGALAGGAIFQWLFGFNFSVAV